MPETTDIEKKSLEAHVELCAERYKFLEQKIIVVADHIDGLRTSMDSIHDSLDNLKNTYSKQLMTIGGTIITALLGVIGYLLSHYIVK